MTNWADREILITTNANQFKTLEWLAKVARENSKHPFVQESIKKYKLKNDPDSLRKIARAAFNIAKFEPDPPSHQYIRNTTRILKDRRANCVDYTGFISGFLIALKVPHIMRMAAYNPQNLSGYSHIYPLTTKGIVMDVVPSQDQTGLEYKKPSNERRFIFNREVPYLSKFDKIIRA